MRLSTFAAAIALAGPLWPSCGSAADSPTYATVEPKDVEHTAKKHGWVDCGTPGRLSLATVEVKGIHQSEGKATAWLTAVTGSKKGSSIHMHHACDIGNKAKVTVELFKLTDGRWFIPAYYEHLEKAP